MDTLLNITLAPTTTRSYKAAFHNYTQFCNEHNLQQAPVIEANLLLFISQLTLHTSYSNIKTHLAAIKHFLIIYGYHHTFPPLPRLYMLTRTIKRQAKNKPPIRSPITIPELTGLHTFLQTSRYIQADQAMLWAAYLTAFFGFLRSSEFVSPTIKTFDQTHTLLITDVYFVGRNILIHIKTSKTDPFSQGCTIKLAPTQHKICPVTALKDFLKIHPTRQGPLFTYTDGTYSTRWCMHRALWPLFECGHY